MTLRCPSNRAGRLLFERAINDRLCQFCGIILYDSPDPLRAVLGNGQRSRRICEACFAISFSDVSSSDSEES